MPTELQRLLEIMAALRDPDTGCPWDLRQTFRSIAPYTIEEAHEVADAIALDNMSDLQDELGDLLLQVVFHAQMAKDAGKFDFEDVAQGIADKLERRHPHVFGDASVSNAEDVNVVWEDIKAAERERDQDKSALAGVSAGLPDWLRSVKLQKRAARVGFDWPDAQSVMEKIEEELEELDTELANAREHANQDRIEEEFGDLMFALLNLSRHLKIDPGTSLRKANQKFERRFRTVEQMAQESGNDIADMDLDAMEALWCQCKALEKSDG